MSDHTLDFAVNLRKLALQMVARANASHIGSCLSIADIVAVLYGSVLNIRPADPAWSDRDRFILSKGHSGAAIFAALGLRGFFPLSDLDEYGMEGSSLMAHVSHKVKGVELSTGSLGHGLPVACGKALAAKRTGAGWRVFTLLSDGEMDEGSNWEALLCAAHHKLDNLVAVIDYNKLQSLTSIERTLGLEPLIEKLLAFGWSAREIDGHDHQLLEGALRTAPWQPGKPSMLVCHTVKGKGVPFMENKVEWHYKSPNVQQLADALRIVEESRA